MDSHSQFKKLREDVYQNLLEAAVSLENWESLQPTEKVSGMMDMFSGFFPLARAALLDRFFIKAYNVVDPHNSEASSLYRLLAFATKDPSHTLDIDLVLLRRRLRKLTSFIGKLKTYRDRRAAHSSTERDPEEVKLVDCHELLDELQAIFGEIYLANTGNGISFELWHTGGGYEVIDTLDRYYRLHQAALKVIFSQGSDPVGELRKAMFD